MSKNARIHRTITTYYAGKVLIINVLYASGVWRSYEPDSIPQTVQRFLSKQEGEQ